MEKSADKSWEKIFQDYNLTKHNFDDKPAVITATQIKKSCQKFTTTAAKEVRILCKQDTREKRPKIFQENNLFLLPIKNGKYSIIRGEGYVNIPKPEETEIYNSKLNFELETSNVGNSEMQHLDFAFATSLIRSFVEDPNLILTIRGRKYTPEFDFFVNQHRIVTKSVQTEVDSGYESDKQVILIEAKNSGENNTIIRQLYYPFRQWQTYTKKPVKSLFFEKKKDVYSLWLFGFSNIKEYNSIQLLKSKSYIIQ